MQSKRRVDHLLLGLLLNNGAPAVALVADRLKPDNFGSLRDRKIYEAILSLFERGFLIDTTTVDEELRKRNAGIQTSDLVGLTLEAPLSPEYAKSYATIIREHSALRDLQNLGRSIQAGAELAEADAFELYREAEERLSRVASGLQIKEPQRAFDIAMDLSSHLNELRERKEMVMGTPTGLSSIDRYFSGLWSEDLIVIAGRPSMGKSALCQQMAESMAVAEPIPFFSNEMSARNMLMRSISRRSGVDMRLIRSGMYSSDQEPEVQRALEEFSGLNLIIDDDGGLTTSDIRARTKKLKAQYDFPGIFVDYLQLMRSPSGMSSRDEAVGEMTRQLKELAKELKIWVVLVAAMNRGVEQREGKRPQLSDLRESGTIEYHADVVAFVYRPEFYGIELVGGRPSAGMAYVIVGKNRNGPTDEDIELHFNKSTVSFSDSYIPPLVETGRTVANYYERDNDED